MVAIRFSIGIVKIIEWPDDHSSRDLQISSKTAGGTRKAVSISDIPSMLGGFVKALDESASRCMPSGFCGPVCFRASEAVSISDIPSMLGGFVKALDESASRCMPLGSCGAVCFRASEAVHLVNVMPYVE
jgi:hypothetical protein